jgi:hypothetical protein
MAGRRFLIGVLRGLPLIVAGYLLLLGVVRTFGMLVLPYQAEYGEGPVLEWARQIATGTLPYKPINTPPYNFSVYTPLYLAISGILIPLYPDNPYLGGRLVSLLSAVGLGVLIWYATSRRGVQPRNTPSVDSGHPSDSASLRYLPLLAILLWLVSPYVFRWSTFYRPDMLALFWSGLGMTILYNKLRPLPLSATDRGKGAGGWGEVIAALCFVLAFFTKQSFFAAPLAALIYLVATRQYQSAIRLGVAGAVLGGIVGAGLYAFAGWALVENLIAANANLFSWEAVWFFWSWFLATVPILILLTLWSLRRRDNWLWGLYLGIAVIVSLSIGKAGAWENYFLEPLWILCVLVSRSTPLSMMERGAGGVRFILILLQLLLYLPGYERLSLQEEMAWLAGVRTEGAVLQAAVAEIPPQLPIYSEQMGVLAETGRTVPLHSFVYTQLARQGLWDETTLNTHLAGGEGLVIQRFDAVNDPLQRGRWTQAMLDAIERGYGFGEQIGEWVIRPATAQNRFYFSEEPIPLDHGLTLLNWEAESCTTGGDCTIGERGVALSPNGTLTLHTLWQNANKLETPLSISVKLFDPAGQFVTQQDGAFRNGWMGDGWVAGGILRDMPRSLSLPATLPAGVYEVEVTLYESESGTPLAVTRLPYFKVPQDVTAPPAPISVEHDFASRFIVVGHTPIPATLQAGDSLTLNMTYQALTWDATRYTTFLHLIAADGTLVGQTDFEPPYPPSVWNTGETITIPYTLSLPTDLPMGTYRLLIGWYDSETLVRLPVDNGSDFVDIGNVMIVE